MRRHRYAYLDGLRGIAAIIVMIFHTYTLWTFNFYHGYLAVDIFFLMSGFVLASAYDHKIANGTMSLPDFLKIRLIRLYPVYLISLVIAVPFFLKHYLGEAGVTAAGLAYTIKTFASALFMLPYYSTRTTDLFSINMVYWSLFFELIANIVYAALHRFIAGRKILVAIAIPALILIGCTLVQGNMDGGVAWTDLLMGFSRGFFGIFAGAALYRYRNYLSDHLAAIPGWIFLIVVCLPLATPQPSPYDVEIDLVAVFAIFPICLLGLAQAKASRFDKGLLLLGSASYPLYLFHVPAWRFVDYVLHYHAARYAPNVGLITLAFLLVFSIIIERKFDEPFRRWLTSKWVKNPPAGKAVAKTTA